MEEFTPEMVPFYWRRCSDLQIEKLKAEVEDYQKNMWVKIGKKLGMSANGCKKQARNSGFY